MAPDQQMDAADLRQLGQQIREPDLTDETRAADEQYLLSAQCRAHGKRDAIVLRVEMNHGHVNPRRRPLRRPDRFVQYFWFFREAKVVQQL